MQWLDRARAILNGMHGLSLPDPDRIDIGSVPDTAVLIRAIDAAMPRTAALQLIGPRYPALRAFLAKRSIARRRSTDEYFVSLEDGSTAEVARLAARCAPDDVCVHLLVQDGEHTLLEAFGRDRGEDVVWVSRRLSRKSLRTFLEVASTSRSTTPPDAIALVKPSRTTGRLRREQSAPGHPFTKYPSNVFDEGGGGHVAHHSARAGLVDGDCPSGTDARGVCPAPGAGGRNVHR